VSRIGGVTDISKLPQLGGEQSVGNLGFSQIALVPWSLVDPVNTPRWGVTGFHLFSLALIDGQVFDHGLLVVWFLFVLLVHIQTPFLS